MDTSIITPSLIINIFLNLQKYIQWGPIGESMSEIIYNKSITDIPAQSLNSSLKMLHSLLTNPEPILSSFIISAQSMEAGESKVDAIVEGVAKFLGMSF